MRKDKLPRDLALDIMGRSRCNVMVGAVIVDSDGRICSWGWNWGWTQGGKKGAGMHAEMHAVSRCNPRRLAGSTIYVAAQRKTSGNPVMSRPCDECMAVLLRKGVYSVEYTTKEKGKWETQRYE